MKTDRINFAKMFVLGTKLAETYIAAQQSDPSILPSILEIIVHAADAVKLGFDKTLEASVYSFRILSKSELNRLNSQTKHNEY